MGARWENKTNVSQGNIRNGRDKMCEPRRGKKEGSIKTSKASTRSRAVTHRLPRPDPPKEASFAIAQVALPGVARPLALGAALRDGLGVHPAEGVDAVARHVTELHPGVAPLGALPSGQARSRGRWSEVKEPGRQWVGGWAGQERQRKARYKLWWRLAEHLLIFRLILLFYCYFTVFINGTWFRGSNWNLTISLGYYLNVLFLQMVKIGYSLNTKA